LQDFKKAHGKIFGEQGVEFFSIFFPINKPILTFLFNAFRSFGYAASEKYRFVLISQFLVYLQLAFHQSYKDFVLKKNNTLKK